MKLQHTSLFADVIVTRHKGTREWLAAEFGGELVRDEFADDPGAIPIVESATEADVTGKVVVGNLPLSLAAKARQVFAVEFQFNPPRGRDFGIDDMVQAGVVLRGYRVVEA